MKPRTSALDRRTAMRLAATEYERCGVLMQSLDSDSWSEPTICPQWDVRQMAAHKSGDSRHQRTHRRISLAL